MVSLTLGPYGIFVPTCAYLLYPLFSLEKGYINFIPKSVRCPSIHTHKYFCGYKLWTVSVYFNGIYSVDTQNRVFDVAKMPLQG